MNHRMTATTPMIAWGMSAAAVGLSACATPSEDDAPKPAPPTLVWAADFETAAEVEAFAASVENTAAHPARGQISRSETGCNGADSECIVVAQKKPIYGEDGQILTKYNVNGEPWLGGWKGDEATLTYRFKTAPDFDFVKLGKLPGIGPANPAFGGDAPFPPSPEKWSVRMMWVDPGEIDDRPVPSLYLYDQYRAQTRPGEGNLARQFIFDQDTWYEVAIYVKLNTGPTIADGRTELWIDGELVMCRAGLTFRGTMDDSTQIQRLAFHNYYGGSAKNPKWFPANTGVTYLDDFKVYEGRATSHAPPSSVCDTTYLENYLTPKTQQ